MAGQRKTFSTVAFTKPTAEESLPPAAPVAPTPPPVHTPVTPPTPHTSHTVPPAPTPQTDVTPQRPAVGRRTEPVGMTRRTYYYSEHVADALAAAVDRIHYDSRGRIAKHQALDAVIAAGVEQVDAIVTRLLGDS